MGIKICSSFTTELLQGVHDFTADNFYLALYDYNASFSSDTTAYSATNEISVGGYAPGGAPMSIISGYPQEETGWGSVRFDTVTWTFTASTAVKYGLVYNNTKSQRSILSLEFGLVNPNIGDFVVRFPLAISPLIQIRIPTG